MKLTLIRETVTWGDHGDCDDYQNEAEVIEEYDINNYLDLIETLDNYFWNYSWLEWSSSQPSSGDWLNSEESQCFRTGDSERYSLHFCGVKLTPRLISLIEKAVKL